MSADISVAELYAQLDADEERVAGWTVKATAMGEWMTRMAALDCPVALVTVRSSPTLPPPPLHPAAFVAR